MRRFSPFAFVVALVVPSSVLAQPPGSQNADPVAVPNPLPVPAENQGVRLSQLHDFHFATWVLIESDSINNVNRWAEEQVRDPAVKEFAQDSIAAHDRLMSQLRAPIAQSFQEEGGSANDKFDFGLVLQEISKRLNETNAATASPAETTVVVETPRDVPATSASESPRAQAEARRPRERRLGQRLADAARDGDNRRTRETVQMLRDNLPRLLDELGASVDAADQNSENVGLAFIELKRQLSERYAKSMIEELGQGPQADIVPGYLGIQLVSNLQLINTMTVAQQHASPELQGTFQQGIDDARVRVQRTRELMASSAKGATDSPPRP
jgi:hypothetical protein